MSSRSSTVSRPSLDLPSLEALSHNHPLLSQPTFDPDILLQSRSHVPLDELRGELRSYLTVLREELVQLINEDYEEFIALGVGLRGEVQRLKRLEQPLLELQHEVDLVNQSLQSHESRLQASLERRTELRDESNLLESMHKLFEAVSRAELVEDAPRIGNEYSQIKYMLSKLEGCSVVSVLEPRLLGIRQRIESKLATALLEAIEHQATQDIVDCLKVYDIIEGWEQARRTVSTLLERLCEQIMPPTAVPATPKAPKTPGHSRQIQGHTPLAGIYNYTLDELQDLCLLFDLAEDISPKFAFSEVAASCAISAIRKNMSIFSAGRPDELHENYTTTGRFLHALEELAPSPSSVANIRSSPELAALTRQWQLPVYFQLRWKDIVSRLEKSFDQPPASTDWLIPQSAAVREAVENCWAENVFIQDLADRFWRLTLQIISRYRLWLQQYTNDPDEEVRLRSAVKAAVDLEHLARMRQLQNCNDLLSAVEYEDIVSTILTSRCVEQLKPIRAVASQLRTTTGSTSTHSAYISSVFRPLQTIIADFPAFSAQATSRKVVKEVFNQYAGMLTSVRKTEDLLRRHRKSRKTGFSLFGSGESAEDEEGRFDEQMRADVARLGKEASALAVDIAQLSEWDELCQVMERAVEP